MRKFRSTGFSFIFKGRSVDFHRHMKKKSCEDFMNEQEKIYEYLHHGRKVCYTTEYQSGKD